MSKYIESRQLKILELSKQLSIINDRVDSYISFLENFKPSIKIDKHFVLLNLNDIKTKIYKENEAIFFKKFNINIKIDNQYIEIFFNEDFSSFYDNKLPLHVLTIASSIILQINQEISFDSISKDIKESEILYKNIIKINEEIDLKKSGFIEQSNFVLKNIKEFLSKNIQTCSKDNTKLFYFMYKCKSIKSFNIQNCSQDKCHFSIIEPEQISLFQKYNIDVFKSDQYDKKLMLEIYKEEFFKLNPHVQYFLIPVSFYISKKITDELVHPYCYFSINDISEYGINIIYEKLKFKQQLNDF